MLLGIQRTPGRSGDDRLGNAAGVTLLELIVAVTLFAIVITIGTANLRSLESPLRLGGQTLEGVLKQTRARAMSTTTVHRVRLVREDRMRVEEAPSCSSPLDDWQDVPNLAVSLPMNVRFASAGWAVCFTSRGIADNNLTLTLRHPEAGSRQLEVLKGGVLRWLD